MFAKKFLPFLLIPVLFGCDQFSTYLPRITKTNFVENSIKPAKIDKKIPTVLNVPPQEMRKALADSYRLPLDRRFIWSIPNIHQFITGEPTEEVQTQFTNEKWEVLYKGKMVAQIPDLPDFKDVMEPIVSWTTKLAKEKGFKLKTNSKLSDELADINQSIDAFFAPNLLRASKKLNALWKDGNRHPEILKSSSRALVYLSLQNFDKLSIADPLLAKTLATVALTQALTNLPMAQEESLLAEIMGYNSHAMQKAKTLPANDPVRLYVNQSNKKLVTLAEKNDKNLLLKFLVLNRFAEKKDLQQWAKWMQTHFGNNHISLAILGTGLRLNTFRGNGSYPRLVQGTINFELESEKNKKSFTDQLIPTIDKILSNSNIYSLLNALLGQNPDFDKLLDEFEKNVTANGEGYQGPFLDLKTYKSFYESYYYTSLYKEGLFHLDNRSSVTSAKLFLAQLKGKSFPHQIWVMVKATLQSLKTFIALNITSSKSLVEYPIRLKFSGNPISKEFIHWYEHILDAEQGKGNIDNLAEDLISFEHLGDAALFRTYKSLRSVLHMGDAGQFTVVKRLIRAMDTRVHHRIELAKYSQERLLDLKMMDRLYQSAFSINPNIDYYQQSLHAFFANDVKKMKAMVKNPNIPPHYRGIIIYNLGILKGFSSKEQLQAFQGLVRDHPEKWMLISRFVDFLFKEENYTMAKTVIQDWIDKEYPVGGLERYAAWNKLAETFYLEGNYEMAWEKISNAISGGMGRTFRQAGNILEKLGEIEEADKAFSAAIYRYPSSVNAIADYSGFLWRHGKYEKAAELIANKKRYISNKGWIGYIGKAFAETFKEKTPEGIFAFDLLKTSVRDNEGMSEMAKTVFNSGNPVLAFKMQSSLKFGGNGMKILYHQALAFKYLKEFVPKEEAMRWLKKVIHPGHFEFSSMFLFGQKDYESIWSFVRSPDAFGWTLRAASTLKYDGISDRDRRKLYQYFALPGLDKIDGSIGKYFLDLVTEEQLLLLAENDENRCVIAYFIGFRAEAEGRYEDASDWYRIALESGGPRIGPYHWAFARLFVWKSHFKKLSILAKEGV